MIPAKMKYRVMIITRPFKNGDAGRIVPSGDRRMPPDGMVITARRAK